MQEPPSPLLLCNPRRSETTFPPLQRPPLHLLPGGGEIPRVAPLFQAVVFATHLRWPDTLRGNRRRGREGRETLSSSRSKSLSPSQGLFAPLRSVGPSASPPGRREAPCLFGCHLPNAAETKCGWPEATFAFRSGVRASNEPGSDRLKAGAFLSPWWPSPLLQSLGRQYIWRLLPPPHPQ